MKTTANGMTAAQVNEIKRYPTVTNPIKADDLHTPQAYAYTLRRAIVTDCNDRQRAELVELLDGKESAEGVTFNNTKANRDRLHIWQNSESRKERARILGSSWEWIDWQNSRRAMIGDRVCTIDGTTGTVTATSPEGVCIKFKSDRDGIEYSCGAYFIECAFNWEKYNQEKPARQQAAPLYTLDGEEYRQGDRVKIRTYYADLPEVVGILTRKEPQGGTVEVLADTGRTYYGWYGSTKRADAA